MYRSRIITITDELRSALTCSLCKGVLVNATTVKDCNDSFCRHCIRQYFEATQKELGHDWKCPKCGVLISQARVAQEVRANPKLQEIVYRLLPDVHNEEMARRRRFYQDNPEALQAVAKFLSTDGSGVYRLADETGAHSYRSSENSKVNTQMHILMQYRTGKQSVDDDEPTSDANELALLRRARKRASEMYQKPKRIGFEASLTAGLLQRYLAQRLQLEDARQVRLLSDHGQPVVAAEAFGDAGEVLMWTRICSADNKGMMLFQFEIVPVCKAESTCNPEVVGAARATRGQRTPVSATGQAITNQSGNA